MTAKTERKIREAMYRLGHNLWTISDIARAAGVAESTVRRHRDELVARGILSYTSYVRYMSAGRAVPR